MNQPRVAAFLLDAAPFLLSALYAALALAVFRGAGASIDVLTVSAVLGVALLALSIIDLRTMRLPDMITLPLIATGPILAYALEWGSLFWHILAAFAGFSFLFLVSFFYEAVRDRAGLGLGDAKLYAAAGAWLGLAALPSVMLWACGIALVAVLAAYALKRPLDGSSRIPFGPFLSLGFWLVWLYGPVT